MKAFLAWQTFQCNIIFGIFIYFNFIHCNSFILTEMNIYDVFKIYNIFKMTCNILRPNIKGLKCCLKNYDSFSSLSPTLCLLMYCQLIYSN